MSHVILNEGKIAVEYVGSNPITRATRVKLPVAKRVWVCGLFQRNRGFTILPDRDITKRRLTSGGIIPQQHLRFRVATNIKNVSYVGNILFGFSRNHEQ